MNWDRRSYTKEEFVEAWGAADSIADTARALGLVPQGGTHKSLKLAAKSLGLTTEHMTRSANNVFRGPQGGRTIPLDEILVENSTYSASSGLRKRLLKEGILEAKCSAPYCPVPYPQIDPWTGEETETLLTLDHINGINDDNRVENLRILCDYCHAHTPTYGGKHHRGVNHYATCSNCGIKVSKQSVKFCKKCSSELNSVFHDISTEELIAGVEKYGYLKYSKTVGVSDTAVRKRLLKLGVNPLPKRRIKI